MIISLHPPFVQKLCNVTIMLALFENKRNQCRSAICDPTETTEYHIIELYQLVFCSCAFPKVPTISYYLC